MRYRNELSKLIYKISQKPFQPILALMATCAVVVNSLNILTFRGRIHETGPLSCMKKP